MSSAAPKRYRVRRSGPLRGSVRVPGDKSIGHRSLIFAALGRGASRITGLSEGLDNAATRQAFRSMGVDVQSTEEATTVHGVGLRGLQAAARHLPRPGGGECANLVRVLREMGESARLFKFGSGVGAD